MNSFEPKKYLLLQIRHEPEVCAEEYQCFLQHSGLPAERLDIFNIYTRSDFDKEILNGYAALLVGGASEANVLQPQKYAFIDPAIKLMRDCAESGFPVFASCFGFQLAVLALGGRITDLVQHREIGTIPIELSAAATTDPLFASMPNPLTVVSVHQQSAVETPAACVALASTQACLHSFKVLNKPFWAFQFHPEVNLQTLIKRLTRYQEKYIRDSAVLKQILVNSVDTPIANTLPARFVDYVENSAK